MSQILGISPLDRTQGRMTYQLLSFKIIQTILSPLKLLGFYIDHQVVNPNLHMFVFKYRVSTLTEL